MFYYAEINSNYEVIAVHALNTASTNANYIEITADQYTSGAIVGKFYNRLTGAFEILDIENIGYIGEANMVKVEVDSNMILSTKLDNMQYEINEKADSADLAPVATSGNYNDLTNKPTIPTVPSSLPANGGNADTVDGKHATDFATAGHNHDSDYADVNHDHTEYANAGHNHDSDYADINHSHTEYANASHSHTGYASTGHTHSDYANASHTHAQSDITGLATTLSGKANATHTHSDYALKTEVDSLTEVVDGKAATGHTHTAATTSNVGFMSANDKSKLDGIAAGANKTTVDSALSSTSTNPVQNKVVNTALGNKVDKVSGKGLSTNDYTTTEKNKLAGIAAGANAYTHPSYTAKSSGLYKVTVDATGHVSGATAVAKSDITALGIPSTNTTYGNATTSTAGLMSTTDKAKLDGVATGANKYTHPSTHAASMITGLATVATSGSYNDLLNKPTSMTPTAHTHAQGDVTGLATALNGKAPKYATEITETGTDLNNFEEAGVYVFAQAYAPANVPAGTNGWLIVIPWAEGSQTVKQIWIRHGTVGNNDFETYVRSKVGQYNVWGEWSKYYTTSNPPTAAEVGATPAFTNSTGGVEYSYGTNSGKNLLTEIDNMPQGLHTIYSIGGTAGNPKTTESWRLLVHKTSATIGWIVGFGSSGSVYTNYQNAEGSFTGWRCVYEATNKMILWSGVSYLTSTNSNPQTVTPSKPLSQCRTGWLLLWSDYDASTGTANDSDFCTTFIPKYTPSGGTWGGKAFLCSLPTYVGGDPADLSTQITVIKPIYVHDDCLKGSYQNTTGGRNDVVLRAVYEI